MPRPRAPHSTPTDLERDIQARCVHLLTLHGWLVLEMDKAKRGKRKGAFFKGFVDVIALKGTRALVLELKKHDGRVRPDQHDVHATLAQQHGITVHVIRSETELLPHLKEPRR